MADEAKWAAQNGDVDKLKQHISEAGVSGFYSIDCLIMKYRCGSVATHNL